MLGRFGYLKGGMSGGGSGRMSKGAGPYTSTIRRRGTAVQVTYPKLPNLEPQSRSSWQSEGVWKYVLGGVPTRKGR